ncbi:MAG: thioredoxin peroxidase [Chloroflexi bacterium RBG_13_60_13]|nr:MAG: thioredoxin peroxidase [Chloroflexi bacterium RBG_13_60_13]
MEKRVSPPAVGETAPDFVLKDQDGKDFRLSESKGKLVLLSFHPLAWTEVCAKQMQALEQNKGVFESLGTFFLGLSVNTVPSKKAWADHLGVKSVRLLSDFWPHGEVAAAYGIFREKNGFSERANIIVDRKGKTAFVKVYEIRQLPDVAEIIEVLRHL